jgi:hypothetical protein
MRAIVIAVLAIPFWFGVLFFTGESPLVPPVFVVTVLIAMTLTIYVPIRRRPNALLTAALFAGIVAFLSLLIAKIAVG